MTPPAYRRPLLILRPEPGAAETLARAQALGLSARAVPLFTVGPLAWTPPAPKGFDAVMITSANTLRHGGADVTRYQALPAYVVGGATAAAVRAAGFETVHIGPGDAIGLIDLLVRNGVARVLHLCGADRREPDSRGVAITRIATYAARAVEHPQRLDGALAEAPVAMLHSPRAAAHFARLVPDRRGIAIAAISANAAEAAGRGWQRVAIAEHPDDAALLALAAHMCKHSDSLSEDKAG